jgi:hypothetical protein
MTRLHRGSVLGILLVIVSLGLPAPAAACDRACLTDVMSRYLKALASRDPGSLPLAPGARFTEDGVELQVGDGLWKSTIALGPYRLDFVDTRQGVVATHAVLREGSSPILFAARLKVVDRRLTEIETIVAHNADEGALFAPNNLTTPTPVMMYVPSATERMPRDQMISVAARYPAGLRAGSFVTADVPFAPGAYRFENGVRMAGPGCTFQPPSCEDMRTQRIPTLPDVKQRLLAVDEQMGTVLFLLDFGRGSLPGPKYDGKSLVTFEAFKVYGGQVHAAEAVFKALPLNSSSIWDAAGSAGAAAREALQRATAEDHQDMWQYFIPWADRMLGRQSTSGSAATR